MNFLAVGITGYFFIDIYGEQGTPDDLPAVPDVNLPPRRRWATSATRSATQPARLAGAADRRRRLVRRLPHARGPAPALGRREPEGRRDRRHLRLPHALRRGDRVGRLAALGGAYLSIGFVHSFSQNMIAGRGFIALAALIVGRWKPVGALGGRAAVRLLERAGPAAAGVLRVDAALFQALPYVLTLIAVAGLIGRSIPPAADGVPYKRE